MPRSSDRNEERWGARINDTWQYGLKDWPVWANRIQRSKWTELGLIMWDHQSHIVTKLYATQAIHLLEVLRRTNEWRECGLTVGEPAMQFSISDPEREPGHALVNEMTLDPSQLQALWDLLERNEVQLKRMVEAEEKERRRRLAAVYELLLSLPKKSEQEQLPDTPSDDSQPPHYKEIDDRLV